MVQRYLCEFYSYRGWSLRDPRVVAHPGTATEVAIQIAIANGNQAAALGQYARALHHYLDAWGLLPKLVVKIFPDLAVRVHELELLKVDLGRHLMEASAQIMKLRDVVGPEEPIIAPVEPPGALVEIAERSGASFNLADHFYQVGSTLAKAGADDAAEAFITRTLELAGNDVRLQASGRAVIASIALKRGDPGRAREALTSALEITERTGDRQGAAAMRHNLGVAFTMSGQAEEAGRIFADASIAAPSSRGWHVTHTANPGIASVTRPAGADGLRLLATDVGGGWTEMASGVSKQPAAFKDVVRADRSVRVDLQGDGAAEIEARVLQPRIGAASLKELEPHLYALPQFVSYLAHVSGFVLPLALGDTYFAMGDYSRAEQYYVRVRDYAFLNEAIERPMVWRKLARTYVQWANRLYRDRDMPGARAKYEQVVRIVPGGFELTGPLYTNGFAPLVAETLAFLNAPDRRAFGGMDYGRRLVILEARANLNQILNGINYLGFPEEIIPIHSWRYLQNLARYFANQASQAERSYISFKDSAEKEAFTRLALEQAVDAQAAAVEVERRRVSAALEQRRAAMLSADLATTRLANAEAQRTDFNSVSHQLAARDEVIAAANAASSNASIFISYDWAKTLGLDDARKGWESGATSVTMKAHGLVQLLTRSRSKISRDYELRNMGRQIKEMQGAKAVADAQVAVAGKMLDVAVAQQELAELRMEQAQAQLSFFDAQEFTPELWDNLAQAQREISRRYLDWAIGAAFLMERAFEFEYDTDVNRIRFDYTRSELNGLLAADFLLADIDSFSFDRLLETEKLVPAKVIVSLADRFPFQFRQQFQRTGRLDVEISLEDFDRLHPGAHLHKLRRVEVVVEGLVGARGMHGTLSNSGISYYRDRQGTRRIRAQKPETLLLSRFDLRHDGFVFTSEEDVLAVFENSGVASGWILDFPPGSNDIDYAAIGNIHLVFYFEAFHNERVANAVRADLAATAVREYSLGLGLRYQFPDEFFAFQDTGEVTFTVDNAYLPFDHTEAHVTELHVMIQTSGAPAPPGLVGSVAAGGVTADQPLDVNGMVGTGGGAEPLNVFRGTALAATWTVRIDRAANEPLFAAGFAWEQVGNIFVFAEYTYTPRGQVERAVDVAQDPLPSFDVVDDPQATEDAPSAWAYEAGDRRIVQTSNIHGPAGALNLNTDPDKPGTYLVWQTAAGERPLSDVLVRCRLASGATGGIGIVFRYQDVDNFYFFLMDALRGYRRVGKKLGGVFQELATPAVDTANGYVVDQEYDIRVGAVGDAVKVFIDGVEALRGRDISLVAPGRVGFLSWGNTQARFLALSVQPA